MYSLFPVLPLTNFKFFVGSVVPFPVHPIKPYPVFVGEASVISLVSIVYVDGFKLLLVPPSKLYVIVYVSAVPVTVNVVTPSPTINVVPFSVPPPLVLVHELPLYPVAFVTITLLKSTVEPYSKFLVIVAVSVFVHPSNDIVLIPVPAFNVIV